jgi:hypothetical protein
MCLSERASTRIVRRVFNRIGRRAESLIASRFSQSCRNGSYLTENYIRAVEFIG